MKPPWPDRRSASAFINSAIDACNKSSASPTYCSCYANAMADSLSIERVKRDVGCREPRGGNDHVEAEIGGSIKTLPDKLTRVRLVVRPTSIDYVSAPQPQSLRRASIARQNIGLSGLPRKASTRLPGGARRSFSIEKQGRSPIECHCRQVQV